MMNNPYIVLQPSPNPKPKHRRRTKTNLSSTKSRNRNRLKASYVPVPAAVTLSLDELKRADMEHMDVVNASCEICRTNENDDQCLLCDICNKAFHTYCLGMYTIPNEEYWYCPSCAKTAPPYVRPQGSIVKSDAPTSIYQRKLVQSTSILSTDQNESDDEVFPPLSQSVTKREEYMDVEYVANGRPGLQIDNSVDPINVLTSTPLRSKTNDESYLFGIVPVMPATSSAGDLGVDEDAIDHNHVPGRFLTPTRKSSEEFNDLSALGRGQFKSVSALAGTIYDSAQRSELGLPSTKSSSADVPHGIAIRQIGSAIGMSTPNRGLLDASSPYSGMPPFPAVLPASTNTSPIPTAPQFPVELGSNFVTSIKHLSNPTVAMSLTNLAESISSDFLNSINSYCRNLQPPSMSQGDVAENGSELGSPRKVEVADQTRVNSNSKNDNVSGDVSLITLIDRVKKRERPANLREEQNHYPKKINNAKTDFQAIEKGDRGAFDDDIEFVALYRIPAFKREYPEEPSKPPNSNSSLEPSALPKSVWGPFSKGWPGGLFLKLNAEESTRLLNEVNSGNQDINAFQDSTREGKEISNSELDSKKRQSDESGEIEVLSAVTKQLDDLPHFRWMCPIVPFAGQDAEVKLQHCDECRCYVCDDLVTKCPLWNYHSRADRTPNWDEERRLFRTMVQRDLKLIRELPELLRQLRNVAMELYQKPAEYTRVYEEYQGIHAFAGKYAQVLDNSDYSSISKLNFSFGYGKLKSDAARRAASRMGAANLLIGSGPIANGIVDVHQRCVRVLQAAQTSSLNSLGPAIVNLNGEICATPQTSSSSSSSSSSNSGRGSTSRRGGGGGGSQSGGGPILNNQSLAGFLTRTSSDK